MQYTEEHYAEMYNNLPEGLKDLVLSGRLAILTSAIGSRHGLNADQVADLEPAIEDVCLGLITKDELVENIQKNVGVDARVANRIAAEADLEILKPFDAELVISRKQKEDLDANILATTAKTVKQTTNNGQNLGPKDVSDKAPDKKVSDWYQKGDSSPKTQNPIEVHTVDGVKANFDWDKDFGKKDTPVKEESLSPTNAVANTISPNIENKLDQLTESINKLVNTRFGSGERKEEGISGEMQELLKRLEKAEKENEENKKIIRSLQNNNVPANPTANIFGENKIQIDKERKVGIDHTQPKTDTPVNGNIQITSVSKEIPIEKQIPTQPKTEVVSSVVSKDTLDSIVEIRNKVSPDVSSNSLTNQTSTKKVLSLDELVSKSDDKIKQATTQSPQSGTLVFPGLNDEKKVDIKNLNQKDSLKQTLLDDLEFLKQNKNGDTMTEIQNKVAEKNDSQNPPTSTPQSTSTDQTTDNTNTNQQSTTQPTTSVSAEQFKDELLPKTKEERMKALQDKIKALNKGVSVGGKTNIAASGLDPYRI